MHLKRFISYDLKFLPLVNNLSPCQQKQKLKLKQKIPDLLILLLLMKFQMNGIVNKDKDILNLN